jgi:hypothetical protein
MQNPRPSASQWTDFYTPKRCETCGKTIPALDWTQMGADQPFNAWADGWNRAMGGMMTAWTQAIQSGLNAYAPPQDPTRQREHGERSEHHHTEREACGCQECGRNDCSCSCCVGDSDLLVQARVGERRVVPILIENTSHREKSVELELSDWSTHKSRNQALQVTGKLLEPLTFTIPPCSEQAVTLVVEAMIDPASTDPKAVNRITLGDVDGCSVYYADLRVKGCDIRPVRIALSLLGRDCSPLTIDCRCECC